ncbi:hypothetical protein D9758_002366 [Tetrapyrgos nigripes]|uniref:RWD domain-containing protein n=1 Tax=Tetrapyrgos nigripes TaxID=182062 RepID=A0A8H5GNF0_9AGAR|nr:hypothetical protein D9758_002366 [Tetrapyrgos nigripes]
MSEGPGECHSLQKEELEVLESIYPDYILDSSDTHGNLKFEVPVEFSESQTVILSETFSSGTEHQAQTLSLSTLPPLLLHVALPALYPISQPPIIELIRSTHLWLPYYAKLQALLIDKWQEGNGVLYDWISYLHDGEFLQDMGLRKDNNTLGYAPARLTSSYAHTELDYITQRLNSSHHY